jgi:RNA recognition motif-containing protein
MGDCKLFVGRLPEDIRADEIEMIFNTYGKVAEVHLLAIKGPNEPRAAFVTYETAEAAKIAIQVLDDVYKFREHATEAIRVRVANQKGGDKGYSKGYDRGGYDSKGGYDRGYDRYKPTASYDTRSYDRGGYDRGYDRGGKGGYASYDRGYDRGGKGGYSKGYDDWKGGGRGYDRYDDRRSDSKGSWGSGKGGKSDNAGGRKLYVENLPTDIQKDALEQVFSTYGKLDEVHVMTGRANSGQAAAFVRYLSPADAKTAIAAMEQGYEIRPGEGNIVVRMAHDRKGPY